eukprot:TRINITY_DN10009_c1_g2_i2.p1 TRINITY_DN10009_c1_g2~~TRINITY_DN10009_c1_g2_i2.p1  ORF type:complete len:117 (-),score=1.73 TRINITY_DN10009_c1_g2_i2:117-467(-)
MLPGGLDASHDAANGLVCRRVPAGEQAVYLVVRHDAHEGHQVHATVGPEVKEARATRNGVPKLCQDGAAYEVAPIEAWEAYHLASLLIQIVVRAHLPLSDGFRNKGALQIYFLQRH